MTITQIKYFLTLAKCLNFTKAADILFITQPALSRQISAMENELNIQLFIRSNRFVKLTPPALILQQEFERVYRDYNLAVAKAQNSFQGLSGELNIGVLEGAYVGDLFPNALRYMESFYPQVRINLHTYSFNQLIHMLYQNQLDLIVTLKFDLEQREHVRFIVLEKTRDYVVVHKDHPLANSEYVTLKDFENDTILMVDTEDSEESPRLIISACKNAGFTPKVKFASSLSEEMLWVEAGVGVCILDGRNILRGNPMVRFLNTDVISDPSLSLAWNEDFYNPIKKVFIDQLKS